MCKYRKLLRCLPSFPSGIYPNMEWINSVFCVPLLKKLSYNTDFHSNWVIWCSYQQRTGILISPNPLQYLLLSIALLIAILMGVQCISLNIPNDDLWQTFLHVFIGHLLPYSLFRKSTQFPHPLTFHKFMQRKSHSNIGRSGFLHICLKIYLFILCGCMLGCMYVCAPYVYNAQGQQKWVLETEPMSSAASISIAELCLSPALLQT